MRRGGEEELRGETERARMKLRTQERRLIVKQHVAMETANGEIEEERWRNKRRKKSNDGDTSGYN